MPLLATSTSRSWTVAPRGQHGASRPVSLGTMLALLSISILSMLALLSLSSAPAQGPGAPAVATEEFQPTLASGDTLSGRIGEPSEADSSAPKEPDSEGSPSPAPRTPPGIQAGQDASATVPAYHDLSHYHSFSPVVRKPDLGQIGDPNLGRGIPLEPRNLLVALLSSCKRSEQLRVADETWCSPHHHDGMRCVAYVDCDEPPRTTAAEVVPASEYLVPWHEPHGQCCDKRVDALSPDGWDGIGPSSYYCADDSSHGTHVAQTLPAQYRFMPALRHATSMHMRDETSWLVMVDDDSWVAVPRLLQVLGEYNHEEPLQASPTPNPPRTAALYHCAPPTRLRPTLPSCSLAAWRLRSGTDAQRHALEAAVCMRWRWHHSLSRCGRARRLDGMHARARGHLPAVGLDDRPLPRARRRDSRRRTELRHLHGQEGWLCRVAAFECARNAAALSRVRLCVPSAGRQCAGGALWHRRLASRGSVRALDARHHALEGVALPCAAALPWRGDTGRGHFGREQHRRGVAAHAGRCTKGGDVVSVR